MAPAGSMPSSVWPGAVHSVGGPESQRVFFTTEMVARYSRLAHEVGGNDRDMGEPTTSGYCQSNKCGSNGIS
ncbi:unnamed protein product [Linum tenue]|uniref:Uncharacterized protein n=1 Tax=Linum tenue TaxID=586396 RepID=A0AAV0R3P5_9ROSI|nr:unnamed protein product [Linum tenue]